MFFYEEHVSARTRFGEITHWNYLITSLNQKIQEHQNPFINLYATKTITDYMP